MLRKICFFIVGIALYSQVISKITEETLQSRSQSIGAGGRVQGSFGTAWGASGYGSGSRGKGTYKQVREQSGLFAEEGGYHITANNVHLRGGAIASTNGANSELATNKLTFEDIQNRSQSQGISGGISGTANLSQEAQTEAEAKEQGSIATLNGIPQSNGISPSLPMANRDSDHSTTKATLTEGNIRLNKDSTPMQTTAKALGINTELSQANQQIQQPKDINKMLKEQQTFAQSAGNIAGAVNAYANQKAEEAKVKAEQAKSEGNLTAYSQAKAEQESWEQGGSARRNAQTVATAFNVALAGGNAGAIGVAAVSPYLNEKVKEITTDEKGEVNKPANILGHAILGAIEAKATGNNALAGAVAGVTGEGTAMIAKEVLYKDKPTAELNESERQNIVSLSQIVSGVAGAVVGDSSQNAVVGAEIGKRAVENNALTPGDVYRAIKDLKEALANGKSVDEVYEKYRKLSQEQRAELLSNCGIDCRIPVGMLLNNANEMARSYSGLLGGWLSGLPISERGRFLDLIETENAITLQELDKRKGGFEKGLELGVEIAQSLRRDDRLSNSPIQNNLSKKTAPYLNRIERKPVFVRDSDAAKVANELGYVKTNYRTKSGAVVFKKGNSYITRDVDGHNGGAWKEASSPEKLNSKETRNGTFDINLNRIGD